MELKELKERIYAAERMIREASDARSAASRAYAYAIAESIGLRLGSIVRVKSSIGYGRKQREVIRRYRVENFSYSPYADNDLSLYGVTLLEGGGEGTVHQIQGSWEIEREGTNGE